MGYLIVELWFLSLAVWFFICAGRLYECPCDEWGSVRIEGRDKFWDEMNMPLRFTRDCTAVVFVIRQLFF